MMNTHDNIDDISFAKEENETGLRLDPPKNSQTEPLALLRRDTPPGVLKKQLPAGRAGRGGAAGGGDFVNIANLKNQYGTRVKRAGSIPPAPAPATNPYHSLFPIPYDSVVVGNATKLGSEDDLQKEWRRDSIELSAEDLYGDGAGLGSTTYKQYDDAGRGPQAQTQSSSRRVASKPIQTGASARHASENSKSTQRSSDGYNQGHSLDKENALDHLANFVENGAASMEAAANVIKNGNMFQKKIHVNANILVALTLIDNVAICEGFSTQLKHSTSAPVNKLGFPEGEGKTEDQKRGPWVYVLATVKSVHFGEDQKFYTVERFDTGACQRADRGWMEWIEPGSEGECAAIAAAKRTLESNDLGEFRGKRSFLENSCFSRTARIIESATNATKEFLIRQAELITRGGPPYRIEIRFTTVNFLVICSVVVAFLDQFRYAFLPSKTDNAIMFIIFVAWIALLLELVFEISIRPKDYRALLDNEQAFSPSTVRYINRFHLLFECVALVFAIPDFLPLFMKRHSSVSFAHFAIHATDGRTSWAFIAGNLYFLLIRIRIFGLIRHKRNHWIKPDDSSNNAKQQGDGAANLVGKTDDDSTLRRADTIGTALLLVNSQRAMLLLLLVTGVVPFLSSAANGGRNRSIYRMTSYLHQISMQTPIDAADDSVDCYIYKSGVEAWIKSQDFNTFDTSSETDNKRVVWASIEPVRCGLNETISDPPLQCTQKSAKEKSAKDTESCLNWSNATANDIEALLGIRFGTLLEVTRITESTGVRTKVFYNLSESVHRTAFNSFMLQLTMLLLIIASLGYLRRDARRYVIAPLRKMLKIVLRYAENPLAGAPTNDDSTPLSELNMEELATNDTDMMDIGGRKSKLGSYETEQLITAVTKITDLLRKCWGVAGAGIISSNLARNKDGKNTVVFNPIVPGKIVYAIFGFAGINDFSHLLRSLDKDVMTLINDVARVVHNEVYRWGLGESGQCNKNLGAAFLMVYRIGDSNEVREKKEQATNVFFDKKKPIPNSKKGQIPKTKIDDELDNIQLASIPGISAFADRALLGLIKSFAGINREESIKAWENDYRLGAFVKAFSVEMSVGMDAGWAVEGAVGSIYKIDATYLSPNVNMASRMMCATKQYKLAILVSHAVYEMLSPQAKKMMRHIDTVFVKGSKKKQQIYTFDARHQGVDFFLNKRSNVNADKEADSYTPDIWNKDQDLREMRSHITKDFEKKYAAGLEQYLKGNFRDSVKLLKEADEIMIENVVYDGRLEGVNAVGDKLLDSNSNDEEVYHLRKEIGDGPCHTLVAYMEKENCEAPFDWKGVRQLTSK